MSDDTPTVHVAWARVMADVDAVAKDGTNTSQSYNFRGIDGVMNAVGPALRQHGVIVFPRVQKISYRDVTVGSKGTKMREATVEVEYHIIGPAGDELIEGPVPAESLDSGDKATTKAMSVAYRTFLLQALTIPTHQRDPDEDSYERGAESSPPPPEGWSTWQELDTTWRELLDATENLTDGDHQADVKAWVKSHGLTPKKLTPALADEWIAQLRPNEKEPA